VYSRPAGIWRVRNQTFVNFPLLESEYRGATPLRGFAIKAVAVPQRRLFVLPAGSRNMRFVQRRDWSDYEVINLSVNQLAYTMPLG
jgi:hypothetical protein